jgi:hypothetical protein
MPQLSALRLANEKNDEITKKKKKTQSKIHEQEPKKKEKEKKLYPNTFLLAKYMK